MARSCGRLPRGRASYKRIPHRLPLHVLRKGHHTLWGAVTMVCTTRQHLVCLFGVVWYLVQHKQGSEEEGRHVLKFRRCGVPLAFDSRRARQVSRRASSSRLG